MASNVFEHISHVVQSKHILTMCNTYMLYLNKRKAVREPENSKFRIVFLRNQVPSSSSSCQSDPTSGQWAHVHGEQTRSFSDKKMNRNSHEVLMESPQIPWTQFPPSFSANFGRELRLSWPSAALAGGSRSSTACSTEYSIAVD